MAPTIVCVWYRERVLFEIACITTNPANIRTSYSALYVIIKWIIQKRFSQKSGGTLSAIGARAISLWLMADRPPRHLRVRKILSINTMAYKAV